jgi:hypothetical protein
MDCWICGATAVSGEHLPKASTLRDLFGEVTQPRPLFHSNARTRNRRLQSVDSEYVKLRVLCNECNSGLTQPFDRAWDSLWTYLSTNWASLETGSCIRRYRLFPVEPRSKMIDLHLYAVKLFGCVAAEFEIPMDIGGMANAIKKRRPYPRIYLGIGKRDWLPELKMAGPSDVSVIRDEGTGRCVFAVFLLTIGDWEFQFIYAEPGQQREGLKDTWNPVCARRTRQVRLKEFPDGSNGS